MAFAAPVMPTENNRRAGRKAIAPCRQSEGRPKNGTKSPAVLVFQSIKNFIRRLRRRTLKIVLPALPSSLQTICS
jgi:hypothetical protein